MLTEGKFPSISAKQKPMIPGCTGTLASLAEDLRELPGLRDHPVKSLHSSFWLPCQGDLIAHVERGCTGCPWDSSRGFERMPLRHCSLSPSVLHFQLLKKHSLWS